jgi:hypothetical protein
LGAEEVGVHVLRQFEHLHDRLARVLAAEDHPAFLELGDELRVDLEAVAEAQADARLLVEQLPGERAGLSSTSLPPRRMLPPRPSIIFCRAGCR